MNSIIFSTPSGKQYKKYSCIIFNKPNNNLKEVENYHAISKKNKQVNHDLVVLEKGFNQNGKDYKTYSHLPLTESAFQSLTKSQTKVLSGLLTALLVSLIINWHTTVVVIFGIITTLYFADLLFYIFLIFKTLSKDPEIKILSDEINTRKDWPVYTILCPLYKEWQVLPQFTKAIKQLDYPKKKLQVLLLLEENDYQTIEKAKSANLPNFFEIVIVPHSLPKTKPKACNYGLLKASGEYCVIYDAEDIPDRDQLKKSVLTFEKYVSSKIACVQAKLNFYNPHQNTLTKLFTLEYSLWFDLILPGLQSINAPIPLGGTSNHFKTEVLKKMHGWDAFNVTEDCDLGIRLSKKGYRTAIIDSTTHEESNSNLINWFWQRTRWIKGYMQCYLVHMRAPKTFWQSSKLNLLAFQSIVGGKILAQIINPFMWIITICYFAFRSTLGPFIESFFPPAILYMGVTCLLFGNFLYLFYYMVGSSKRENYHLVKYAFIVPFYWIAMSTAAWVALYKLIKEPHYWSKTNHGLHLKPALINLK